WGWDLGWAWLGIGGWHAGKRPFEIVVLLASNTPLPRQDHARFRPGAGYLGLARVSEAVGSYRNSVSEADLARNIDRELISYRSLVKYYVVTGKEDDAKAAQAAEGGLKAAIDQALASTTKPERREGLSKLATEFKNFSSTFAELVKVKDETARIVQDQLLINANMLKYKLDDVANNAPEAE